MLQMLRERSEKTPVVIYAPVDDCYPVWYRVCPKCGRFVKADDRTKIPEYQGKEPNATCKRCGRVQMEFCCWTCDDVETLEDVIEDAYAAHLDVYC